MNIEFFFHITKIVNGDEIIKGGDKIVIYKNIYYLCGMGNIEIITLSIIITILFAIFIFGPLVYVYAGNHIPEQDRNKYGLLIMGMIDRLNTDKNMSKKDKDRVLKGIQRTISDMESDGVYFPESMKEKIKEQREGICEYSGLPSVESYKK